MHSTPHDAATRGAAVRDAATHDAAVRDAAAGDAQAVAVVGAGCRLPGGIGDLADLWSVLAEGRDTVGEIPSGRFDGRRLVDTETLRPGTAYSGAGCFLDDIAGFDAAYFGISPREAEVMDPQQRLLLETAAEALDDAGIPAESLAGSDTAVYAGVSDPAYGKLVGRRTDSDNPYTMTGVALSIAANRLSYCYDLHGPSITVDTACSSALAALDGARRTLLEGRSRVALVGGVNALIDPWTYTGFSHARMLSPSGRCAAFSAGADGFVRGEGAGVVVLKRLADALADGDRVRGVILGTGVNTSGRTQGIALPSSSAQEALLHMVREQAGVHPDELVYFEAHGTGTAVGDPAEARAVGRALARERTVGPLPVGSVKSNLGHLEPAAGMAGLFKALLVLQHGLVPATLHARPLNPAIDFAGLGLAPATEPVPLPRRERPVVGVNSFGFGGANAHALLTAPPPAAAPVSDRAPGARGETPARLPVIVSARSAQALRELAARVAARLRTAGPGEFYDLAHTTTLRRSAHPYRAAVLADSARQAADELERVVAEDGRDAARGALVHKPAMDGAVFVYSGNGSPWPGMAAGLLDAEPVFRRAVDEADAALAPRLGWSVAAELARPRAARWARTEIAQPALFAVQHGLTALLAAEGVRPVAVTGHSVGEVAAALAAGALTLDDAALVVAARSSAQAATAGSGRMAAVGLPVAEAEAELARYDGALEIAGVNSDRDVTVSGDADALAALGAELDARGVFFRELGLDHAFHSRHMEPLAARLRADLAGLRPRTAGIPFLSTVTGTPLDGAELDAAYWWRNVREPVRFADAVACAARHGGLFVEVGPHPVLRPYLRRAPGTVCLPTLHRDGDPVREVAAAVAGALAAGGGADWSVHFPRRGAVADLPRYPWQHERYWKLDPADLVARTSGDGTLDHPLLGERMPGPHPAWDGSLEPQLVRWLGDHKIRDGVLMPAAAFVDMTLTAGRQALQRPVEVRHLTLERPLALPDWPDPGGLRLQTAVDPASGSVTIGASTGRGIASRAAETGAAESRAGGAHAGAPGAGDSRSGEPGAAGPGSVVPGTAVPGTVVRGTVVRAQVRTLLGTPPPPLDADAVRRRCPRLLRGPDFYAGYRKYGFHHGPDFQLLDELHVGDGELLAHYRLEHPAAEYAVHPVLLDAAFQAPIVLCEPWMTDGRGFLPAAFGAVRVWGTPAARGTVHLRLRSRTDNETCWDVAYADPDGTVFAEIDAFRMRRAHDADRRPVTVQRTVLRAAPLPGPAPASPLPAPARLAAAAEGRLAAVHADFAATGHDSFTAAARQAGAHCWHGALAGLLDDPAAEFGLPDLVAGGLLPRHRRLVRLMLPLLVRHGLARAASGDRWRLAPQDPARAPESLRRLVAGHPAHGVEAAALNRQLRHLPEILRGAAPDARLRIDDPLREQLTETAPAHRRAHRTVAALVRETVRVWPGQRPLRVLELASSGLGLAAAVLPLLPPDRARYTRADASAAGAARAEHRFAAHDFAVHRMADPEHGLSGEEFTDGAYDLVLADDALLRTTDVARTLRSVRRLLAPGGHLLATEPHDAVLQAMLHGADDAFWDRGDRELRPASRVLEAERWVPLLADCGFTGAVRTGDTTRSVLHAAAGRTAVGRAVAEHAANERTAAVPAPRAADAAAVKTADAAETPAGAAGRAENAGGAEPVPAQRSSGGGLLAAGATKGVDATEAPGGREATGGVEALDAAEDAAGVRGSGAMGRAEGAWGQEPVPAQRDSGDGLLAAEAVEYPGDKERSEAALARCGSGLVAARRVDEQQSAHTAAGVRGSGAPGGFEAAGGAETVPAQRDFQGGRLGAEALEGVALGQGAEALADPGGLGRPEGTGGAEAAPARRGPARWLVATEDAEAVAERETTAATTDAADTVGREGPEAAQEPQRTGDTALVRELAALLGAPVAATAATAAATTAAATDDPAAWTAALAESGATGVVLVLSDPGGPDDAAPGHISRTTRRAAVLRALAAACAGLPEQARPQVALITRPTGLFPAPDRPARPADAAVWAAARTLANEHPGLRLRRISLDRGDGPARPAADARRLARELRDADPSEDETVLTPEGRFVPRETEHPASRAPARPAAGTPYVLAVRDPGLSRELAWRETEAPRPGPGEVAVEIRAVALNYRDPMRANGLLPAETFENSPLGNGLGTDAAGVVTAVGHGVTEHAVGDRVFGAMAAALASHALAPAAAVFPLPGHLGYAEAASLPVAFLTVEQTLVHQARLRPGETVLVHGGAGAVGLAAVQCAQALGARVVATAGTGTKRDLLRSLGVTSVLDSRSLEFVPRVRELTGGRGVDVVVNSLSGEALTHSLELLRPGGRFIELGKVDILRNSPLPLRPFLDDLTFIGFNLDSVLADPERSARLAAALRRRVADGTYRPLPYTAYPAARVDEAFRTLQHSRHIGKVVVTFEPQESGGPVSTETATPAQTPSRALDEPVPVEPAPRAPQLSADGTYLVTGGLGGFGAATADWLARHGARRLALVGRRGPASPEAGAVVDRLTARGVAVTVHAADVTDEEAMRRVVEAVDATGHALRGVAHCAMHLDDAPLAELDDRRFAAVLAPKAAGAEILHRLTADRETDLFLLHSSVTAAVGNQAQAPYAAGNAHLEALARSRRAQGRTASAVAWGPLDGTGYVARHGLGDGMTSLGFEPVTPDEALAAASRLLTDGTAVAGVGRYHWARAGRAFPTLSAPRYARLVPEGAADAADTRARLLGTLREMTETEAHETLTALLTASLADVLHTDPAGLDPHRQFQESGVDSLMGTELLLRAREQFDVRLSPTDLMGTGGTPASLARVIQQRLGTHRAG